MSKLLFALCITALAGVFAQQPPSPPVWINQWQSNFTEAYTLGVFGKGNVTGAYYYDWANNEGRMDKSNGKYDEFCGSIKPKTDTPCTHYIVNGTRYIYYPELNSCCSCCTDAKGCGILKNNWLANATYVGQKTVDNITLNGWEETGMEKNYYYETLDGTPYILEDSPDAIFYFNQSTYQPTIVDRSVFDLPPVCSSGPLCPLLSVCGLLREQAVLDKDIIA